MTALPKETLYALLPAVYRTRDLAAGEQLRALLGIIEEELTRLQDDITGLYDNLFIETCDSWVIPYLGDLVGLKFLNASNLRALTANTMTYRRRKGTLQMLTPLAAAVTTWPARGVEYMQLVATSQQMNSARPSNIVIPNLHQIDAVQSIGTPFENITHSVDVRATGRYHRDQVGLFVWRRASYELQRVRAVAVAGQPGAFFMNPLGCDGPLYNPDRNSAGVNATTQLSDVPQPLQRRVLAAALEAHRQALVDGRLPQDPYFGDQPVLKVYTVSADGVVQQVPSEQLLIAALDSWWVPPAQLTYTQTATGQSIAMPIQAAVDPALGRLVFAAGQGSATVFTSHCYGFGGPLGGGGYVRPLAEPAANTRVLQVQSGDAAGVLRSLSEPTLASSVWSGSGGLLCVEIADSDTYAIGPLHIPPGGRLELRAQNGQRPLLQPAADPTDSRWHITLGSAATLILNGLLIAGAVTLDGEPAAGGAVTEATVTLDHCTLVPGTSRLPSGQPAAPATVSLQLGANLAGLLLGLNASISGAINLAGATGMVSGAVASLAASDSILDATGGPQPALRCDHAALARVTVLGKTAVQAMVQAVDTLFCDTVQATADTPGAISYCYLPAGSTVPAPYRCQPQMELAALAAQNVDLSLPTLQLVPWFVSRCYGRPGYAQLDARCHPVIRNGASVQGELGAMQSLQQAQRESNLLLCQAEYLRFGLTLNLFPVT